MSWAWPCCGFPATLPSRSVPSSGSSCCGSLPSPAAPRCLSLLILPLPAPSSPLGAVRPSPSPWILVSAYLGLLVTVSGSSSLSLSGTLPGLSACLSLDLSFSGSPSKLLWGFCLLFSGTLLSPVPAFLSVCWGSGSLCFTPPPDSSQAPPPCPACPPHCLPPLLVARAAG